MNVPLRQGLVLMLALFSSNTFAAFNCQPACLHFYIGGSLGITSLADNESTYNPLDRHSLGAPGMNWGLLIGYNFYQNSQLKLDVETFINDTNLNSTAKQNYTPLTIYKVKNRYNAGFKILPGYEFNCGTEGHLIFGYSFGQFDINDNGNFGIIHQHFSRNGFQAGLGIETGLCGPFTLRTDVVYTVYPAKTSYGITTSTPPSIQTYRNQLSILEGDLTLIYKV